MKYIKTINELFDTSDLKSSLEIPILRGDINFKEIIKDSNITNNDLLSKLKLDCPFINLLGYKINNGNLLIGFLENFEKEDEDVVAYFALEIMGNDVTKKYTSNSFIKLSSNGSDIIKDSISCGIISYNKLVTFINTKVIDFLMDFSKFTKKNYNFSKIPFLTMDEYKKYRSIFLN